MDWVPVDVKRTTGPEWLRISADLRGHWHALVSYCADRENGGTIEGARNWSRSDWSRAVGMYPSSVEAACTAGLCRFHGKNLVVIGYPHDAEDRLSQRRSAGRKGAESRWSGHADATRNRNGNGSAPANGDGNTQDRTGQYKKPRARTGASARGTTDTDQSQDMAAGSNGHARSGEMVTGAEAMAAIARFLPGGVAAGGES